MYRTGQHISLYKMGQRLHPKVPRMESQETIEDELIGKLSSLASRLRGQPVCPV
jgi:hypothetical protein